MRTRKRPRPVSTLIQTQPYAPPRTSCPVDLRLDGNEGMQPPTELLERVTGAGVELLRRYPDRTPLERRLADELSICPDQVLVTAGGDEALDRICRAYLDGARNLVATTPIFEMIPRYAKLAGAGIRQVEWPAGPYPTDALLEIVDEDTGVIAVVSPNNPTGDVATGEDLRRISRAVPTALLLVDLAYAEFADEDLMAVALKLPNAIAVRSLSKAWGLAGLRVGYAAGPADLLAPLRAAGGPYAVSGPSLLLAEAALDERTAVADFIGRIRSARSELQDALRNLGIDAHSSQGNFVYAEFDDGPWVRDALAGLGIGVRLFADESAVSQLRITCPGDAAATARVIAGLRTALAPEALLLDMDGVLADVSRSYRRAILETVRAFGAEAKDEDVAAAKRRTGSNNDWELSQDLLARRGIERDLEEIVACFQEIYADLSARETLIPEAGTLRELAERIPLGIVTGRPRAEAEAFLERFGLSDLFGAMVCLDDAPGKPDSAPVRLALEQLGASTAWMVGDTVNDIVAARAAGVLALGFVPPGESPLEYPDVLTAAGAGRVLGRLADLKEVLPS